MYKVCTRISHKTVGAGSQICFNHSRISREPAPTASGLGFHKFGEKSGCNACQIRVYITVFSHKRFTPFPLQNYLSSFSSSFSCRRRQGRTCPSCLGGSLNRYSSSGKGVRLLSLRSITSKSEKL
jgi:hypothetical protein